MMPPMRTLARALLVLSCVLLAFRPISSHAQAADPADFSIPNGHFYTQSAPGQNGAGYRVANEAGIPFWDEFQRHGGIAELGYPLTHRFTWQGDVVQVFEAGVLRWRGEAERSTVMDRKKIVALPASAKIAELSPRSAGDAEQYPWSGWWWPANFQANGPRLFDADGPLAKYDRFVANSGRPNPRTKEWEQAENFFADFQWAGHCNGWAAAALLELEPKEARTVDGVTFSVADQKGLLTAYHFADAALWGVGGDQELSPAEFHKTLVNWLGIQRKGMIFTFRLVGEEVWSFPAFKYESVVGPDPRDANRWHVRTVVWLVDNNVAADFVGGQPWPSTEGKVFEYTLTGDPQNPDGGEWSAGSGERFGRPYMLWYPDRDRRNEGRQLSSPALEESLIRRIVRGE